MRALLLASSLLLTLGDTAASAATRTFPVSGFDRVRSSVPFEVRVRTGGPASVQAVGADADLARLRVTVRNGELEIDAERGRWFDGFTVRKADRVVVTVTAPRLSGAALSGPGDMIVDALRAPVALVALSGPGNLSIGTLEAGRADVALSGPGDISLAGRAGSARVVASGPGHVRGVRWTVGDATVVLSGPGDVALTAQRTATVRLSGPGNVRIAGRPRCQVSRSGPGNVICGG